MQQRSSDPWRSQEALRVVQANDSGDARRVIICAGQFSSDAQGRPCYPDDMRAQISQALDNLEAVLRDAGLTLAAVVRLNYYTTDVDRFMAANEVVVRRLADAGCRPASTILGVVRLVFPELLIAIDATAVS